MNDKFYVQNLCFLKSQEITIFLPQNIHKYKECLLSSSLNHISNSKIHNKIPKEKNETKLHILNLVDIAKHNTLFYKLISIPSQPFKKKKKMVSIYTKDIEFEKLKFT